MPAPVTTVLPTTDKPQATMTTQQPNGTGMWCTTGAMHARIQVLYTDFSQSAPKTQSFHPDHRPASRPQTSSGELQAQMPTLSKSNRFSASPKQAPPQGPQTTRHLALA